MQHLLVLQRMNESVKDQFVQLLSPYFSIDFAESFDPEYLKQAIRGKTVCFGSSLPDAVVQEADQLKVFQLAGTGVDRINLDLFKSRGIQIFKTQTQSKYVAEFSIALLMGLLKKTAQFDRLLRANGFTGLRYLKGVDNNSSTLLGKTVGIIGYGYIGKAIHRFLSPYDNRFLLNTPSAQPGVLDEQSAYTTLDELVRKSDIIFVTCPLTAASRGLIGGDVFDRAKKSSFWINISRGPVVDFEQLEKALAAQKIAGFALDNWYADITDADVRLSRFDNVLMSPYRAINIDSDNPNIKDAMNNLLKLGKGQQLEYPVDYAKGY